MTRSIPPDLPANRPLLAHFVQISFDLSGTGFPTSGSMNENDRRRPQPSRVLRTDGIFGKFHDEAKPVLPVVPSGSNALGKRVLPLMLLLPSDSVAIRNDFVFGIGSGKAMLLGRARSQRWRSKGFCTAWRNSSRTQHIDSGRSRFVSPSEMVRRYASQHTSWYSRPYSGFTPQVEGRRPGAAGFNPSP